MIISIGPFKKKVAKIREEIKQDVKKQVNADKFKPIEFRDNGIDSMKLINKFKSM